ncbi:MAG: type II secretion system protein [Candidatus Saccharibacteria bacterium]|nr:type II secretion system protein [Candidatus Saccharibacteria bacterium]
MKNKNNNKSGFTIIEVVLVLAIAGLIFLMVFIALPALQRSQRDTQRRDDMSRLSSQITQYQANNRGQTPKNDTTTYNATGTKYDRTTVAANCKSWCSFINNYMLAGGDTFDDPDGTAYTITDHGDITGNVAVTVTSMDHSIHIYHKAKCAGETVEPATGTRQLAIRYKLEGAGTYCESL